MINSPQLGPQRHGVGRVVTGVIKITLESWARIGICQSILLYLQFNQRKVVS
jgi:predicted cation transporter